MTQKTEARTLDDTLVPPMTVRELLQQTYREDEAKRQAVKEAPDGCMFECGILFNFAVPIAMAKEVAAEMQPKKARVRPKNRRTESGTVPVKSQR